MDRDEGVAQYVQGLRDSSIYIGTGVEMAHIADKMEEVVAIYEEGADGYKLINPAANPVWHPQYTPAQVEAADRGELELGHTGCQLNTNASG